MVIKASFFFVFFPGTRCLHSSPSLMNSKLIEEFRENDARRLTRTPTVRQIRSVF